MIFSSNVFAADYSDLNKKHWAYSVIMDMTSKKILSGYPDNTFMPDKTVTRAEFAKILTLTLNLNEKNNILFQDVTKEHWAYNYIEVASKYLSAYKGENNTVYFRPSDEAVREDVAVSVVMAAGLQDSSYSLSTLNKFSDKENISENLKKYVAIAVENELMKGNADGTFNPKGKLTRAEVCQLMHNSQSVLEKIVLDGEKIKVIKPRKVLQLSDDLKIILRYESEDYKRPLNLGELLVMQGQGVKYVDNCLMFLKTKGISYEKIEEEYSSLTEEVEEKYCDLAAIGDGYWTKTSYSATSTLEAKGYDYSVKNLDDDGLATAWVEGVKGDGIGEKITLKMQQYGWSWPDNFGMVQTEDGWRLMTKEEFEKAQKADIHYSYCYSGDKETTYEPRTYQEYKEYVREASSSRTYDDEHEERFIGWYNGLSGLYIVNGYAKNEKLFKANSRVKKLRLTIDGTKEYILELEDTMNPQLFDIEYEQEPNLDKLDAIKAEFEILEVYKGEKYEDTVITTLKGHSYTNMLMGG